MIYEIEFVFQLFYDILLIDIDLFSILAYLLIFHESGIGWKITILIPQKNTDINDPPSLPIME